MVEQKKQERNRILCNLRLYELTPSSRVPGVFGESYEVNIGKLGSPPPEKKEQTDLSETVKASVT